MAIDDILSIPRAFSSRPEQVGVRSCVICPVLVGNEVFGALSFAHSIPYRYSELEINGFLNIANSVGVAIHNFRRAGTANERVAMSVRTSAALTAVAVAQAARHTALTAIDTVNLRLAELILIAESKSSTELRVAVTEKLHNVSGLLTTATKVINDIRAATKPPTNEYMRVSIQAIWEQARDQLMGKLNKDGINCRWGSADVIAWRYPATNWRELFLNLILNSVEAFAGRKTAGRRNVTMRVDPIGNQLYHRLIYGQRGRPRYWKIAIVTKVAPRRTLSNLYLKKMLLRRRKAAGGDLRFVELSWICTKDRLT